MHDQAYQLRLRMQSPAHQSAKRLAARSGSKAHMIAVTSGKGGVGKTNFTVNFAIQLAKKGFRVVLFDADLGLANIDVLLGISPRYTLFDLLRGDLNVHDVMERGPYDIRIIPGSSGLHDLFQLTPEQGERIMAQLKELHHFADFIIVDTGAGLTKQILPLILTADEVVLVTTPEPTAMTDGYAVMKVLFNERPDLPLWTLINRAVSSKEAEKTGRKISAAVERFLHREINILGYLPENHDVVRSVKRQQPFSECFPNSPASRRLRLLTKCYLAAHTKTSDSNRGNGFTRFLQHIIKGKG